MSKYRIVEKKLGYGDSYFVAEKRFFFVWYSISDYHNYSIDGAKADIDIDVERTKHLRYKKTVLKYDSSD